MVPQELATRSSTHQKNDIDSAVSKPRAGKGMLWFAVIGSVAVAATLVASDANIFMALTIVIGILGIALSLYRVAWGVQVLVACSLLFDQYAVPGFEPWTYKISYFENLKVNYLPQVDAAVVSPFELHMFLLLAIWFMSVVFRRERAPLQHVPVWQAALAFFIWLLGAFLYGWKTGGDFLPAIWEVRALCYLAIMYFFIPQVFQTRKQLQTLMWICIGTITFKATQGIERFASLGWSFGGYPTLTSHEDAAFFVTLIVLFFGLSIFGGSNAQRNILRLLLPILIAGYIVAQRRASFGATALALGVLFILLTWRQRGKFIRMISPAVIIVATYLAIFWNSDSALATPAQLVKASFSNEREEAGEKYYSNLYRVYERYNLAQTVKRAPITGIGFGQVYDTPLKLAEISFPLWEYIPHNEILWLLVKTGSIGFFAFWLFLNAFIVRGVGVFSRLEDPYLKSVCAMAVIAIFSQIFISYFDLQLTFHRNMIYLGVLMGLLPTIERLGKQPEESQKSSTQTSIVQYGS